MIAYRRLQKEYQLLLQDPPPNAIAHPDPKNRLKWHYMIHSMHGTPFQGGFYHGIIVFPVEYPHKPPSILMKTPNGRFIPNQRLCFSMSDFHPQTWDPLWSISTIVKALASFMTEEQFGVGSMKSNDQQKKKLAKNSESFNMKDQLFVDLFSKDIQKIKDKKNLAIQKQSVKEKAQLKFNLIRINQKKIRNVIWLKLILFFVGAPTLMLFAYKFVYLWI